MTLALVVEFRIQPERTDQFDAAIQRNASSSLTEESGCLQFDVCRDASDAGVFFLYELYVDAKAIEAHVATVHYQTFNALTLPWVLDKKVRLFQRSSTNALRKHL